MIGWYVVLAMQIILLIICIFKDRNLEGCFIVIIMLIMLVLIQVNAIEKTIKSTSTCESEIATVKED